MGAEVKAVTISRDAPYLGETGTVLDDLGDTIVVQFANRLPEVFMAHELLLLDDWGPK